VSNNFSSAEVSTTAGYLSSAGGSTTAGYFSAEGSTAASYFSDGFFFSAEGSTIAGYFSSVEADSTAQHTHTHTPLLSSSHQNANKSMWSGLYLGLFC
jgi:hypothetical protein